MGSRLSGWKCKAKWVFLACLVVGCSKSPLPPPPQGPPQSPPQPNQVTGSVLFEDTPVEIGFVHLFSDEKQLVRSTPILPDGTFQITGVAEGDYRVGLDSPSTPRTV